MDEKMMKAMVAAGAIRKVNIVGNGARFHVADIVATSLTIIDEIFEK